MLKNGLLFFNINCSVDKRKEIFVRKKPFWYKSTFTRQTETDKPQRKKGGVRRLVSYIWRENNLSTNPSQRTDEYRQKWIIRSINQSYFNCSILNISDITGIMYSLTNVPSKQIKRFSHSWSLGFIVCSFYLFFFNINFSLKLLPVCFCILSLLK